MVLISLVLGYLHISIAGKPILKFYSDQKNLKQQFYTLQLERWKAKLRGAAMEPLLIFTARIPQELSDCNVLVWFLLFLFFLLLMLLILSNVVESA